MVHSHLERLRKLQLFGFSWGGNSSVVNTPLLDWNVGCSIHTHWVNCRSAPWARANTPTAPARSTIQASVCHRLPSPKLTKKFVWFP